MTILSGAQLQFVAGILSDIGQVFFASMVIPFFIAEIRTELILSGLILSCAFWFLGLLTIKPTKL